jgi:hypothetical protein
MSALRAMRGLRLASAARIHILFFPGPDRVRNKPIFLWYFR